MTTRAPGRAWTVEDVLSRKLLTDAQISPDGERIAYVVRDVVKVDTKVPRSSIWLVSAEGGDARQLTYGPRADIAPRWSPDGRRLAFLSDRDEDGRFGIYTISLDGGEARRLADLPGGVSDVRWSPDGSALAFLMTDPQPEEEKRRHEEKDDPVEYELNPRYQRLWVVDADGTGARTVSTGDVQVWELAWLPDGRGWALVCSDLPYEWSWYGCYLATVGLSGGPVSRLYHREGKQVALPTPSPDGESVAFISATWSDRGAVGGDVYTVSAAGGEASCLTQGYPASFGWARWVGARQMLAVGYEEGEAALFRLPAGGGPEALWKGEAGFADRHWAHASQSADGATMAVVREDAASPPDVWRATLPGDDGEPEWTRLTRQQPELESLGQPERETLRWTSPDGTTVQGILLKPLGYEEGRRYPLVTIVHGGPTAMHHHSHVGSLIWAPLLVSEGFAVLLPNPRGSIGWGTRFASANLGDMGGGDLEDILAGVDAAVERGIADPERLGIAGWSYGGFMTAWAITQTDRFKAAVMGAGIANWRSFHGVSSIPIWDSLYYGADAYAPDGPYDTFSALHAVERVRTPTLIVHGERDEVVPVGQAHEWFRALKEHGVETRLIIYPREGHGLQERSHARHMNNHVLEWLKVHLGTT